MNYVLDIRLLFHKTQVNLVNWGHIQPTLYFIIQKHRNKPIIDTVL